MSGCLALNSSYEPLALVPVKRAVRLVLDGKAEIIEDNGEAIRWGRGELKRPTVIKLKRFIKVPPKFRRQVTNTFLFARDSYTCQYCGRHERELKQHKGHAGKLTRDHIVPQSKGGENSWTNCVTACSPCNAKKDDRSLAESGMKLLSIPSEPHLVALVWAVRKLTPMQKKYIAMFYGEDFAKALQR